MNSYAKDVGDHGFETQSNQKGKAFLGHYSAIALFLFILMVVASQFWYTTVLKFFEQVFGIEEGSWISLLLVSIVITVVIYLLITHLFKVPIISLV